MRRCTILIFLAVFSSALAQDSGQSAKAALQSKANAVSIVRLDLPKALELAQQNNYRSKVSSNDVDAALALHGQALSSWWPKIEASITGSRMDEDPNFIFPASTISVPASTFTVPSTTIVLPANSFGPGFPPVDVPIRTPPTNVDIPAQSMQVPKQDVKLMNRDSLIGSVKATLPLYTGGLREARIRQAKAGIEVARQDERRTNLEVQYDVRRLYYAGVLSRRLVQIGRDTLARMEATLELTEKLYTTGSGTVKKTDYLRNKSMVETIRSMTFELESNEKTVMAALVTVIGLDWGTHIELVDEQIAFIPTPHDPVDYVERAFHANPDVAKLDAAVRAAKENVSAAFSGHLPKAGLFASFQQIGNAYDAGVTTERNKTGWAVGFGIDIPVFNGFRVSKEVAEAKARLQKLENQRKLLRDSIALDIQKVCWSISKAQQQQKSSSAASQAATENRELNVRAYQEELVETKEVIEAQLIEALLAAQYQQVLYDHAEELAKLAFLAGSQVN
jgi:outer membrane protein